jgi:CheY-like chemotaxis protein
MIVHQEASPEGRAHPRSASHGPVAPLGSLAGIQIVAVDDDQDALGLLRAVFEAAGADVHTFGSPVDALAGLKTLRPHVLVVDLGMPEMDGFAFIRQVRASPDAQLAHTPAAALTAFARSEDRVSALRAGFEMHLSKPVDPAELVAAVQTLARPSIKRG